MTQLRLTFALLGGLSIVGCAGGDARKSTSGGAGDSFGGNASSPGSPAGTGGSSGTGGAADGGVVAPPPEKEERREFESPRAGARFVYVANPKRDSVAVIDSTTLGIRSVAAGDAPTYLTTVPGKDVAVVVNAGSRDATILRTDASGTRTATVPVMPGANALSVAPDGAHVIVWSDSEGRGGGQTSVGSFQDVTVINLVDGQDASVRLTVGFRPSQVAFASDGSSAFVVTEDGVSVIRFADVRGAAVAPLVPLGDVAADAQGAGDVSVTPDGKFALARRDGSSIIQMVDLATGTAQSLDLKSPVTDLDLSPAGDFAVAVLRATSSVVRIALPAGFSDESLRRTVVLTDETVGSASLTIDGRTAVLYTTATAVERLVLLDLAGTQPPRPVRLKKGIRAVALTPDSASALVVHTKLPGDPKAASIELETMIDRSYGYSVVNLKTGFAKLQLTTTDVGPLALTPDSSRAFVLLRDDQQSVRIAQRIHMASLVVDDFLLGSPPLSIAALAESRRIFVSQLHPEGRISFIDWETGATASVTGFELNGRIVQ